MPYVSQAQARHFNANRGRLEHQGVDVDEWNKATDFSSLPERSNMKSHTVNLGDKGKSFKVKEGSLHAMLHIPQGEKIGQERIRKAEHSSSPAVRRKAISALGLTHMHHAGA